MKAESAWDDEKQMPWGLHRGKPMADIPAPYLLWLYEQPWIKEWPGLYAYLLRNEERILKERACENTAYEEDGFKSFDDYKDNR